MRPPRLDRAEWRLIGLLGAASFFGEYDRALLALLLVQIQQDLGLSEASLGWLGSAVRLGALPAFAVMLWADRIGRRRVLLATIAGYTAATAATAFAPSFGWLVAFQILARAFMTAELVLAAVVLVEELRPDARGWGVGLLGTHAALGHGFAMALFGFVDDVPFGWRSLYAVGVLPLLGVVVLRRGLPETRRFAQVQRREPGAAGPGAWLRPIRELVHRYPRRFAAVAAVTFLWSFSNGPVDFFLPKFAQQVHGWEPGHFARVALIGGGLGLTGQLLAGWASDRVGRRRTFLLFLTLEPVAGIVIYGAAAVWMLPLFATWVFVSVANDVVGRTYSKELFPTAARATAAGALAIVGAVGGVLGLAAEGVLFAWLGTHWLPVRAIAACGLAMVAIVAIAYPETSGRTLEEISPDAQPPDAEGAREPSAPGLP